MKRRDFLGAGLTVSAITLLLGPGGFARRAWAGPAAAGSVQGALTAKLAHLLGSTVYTDELPPEGSCLAFVIPGMPVTAEELRFDLDSADTLRGAADFAYKVNRIPAIAGRGGRWDTDNRLVWNEYKAVLAEANVADYAPSSAERRSYAEAQHFLGRTKAVFDQYQQRHDKVLLDFLQGKLDAKFSKDPADLARWQAQEPLLRARVEAAHRDWVAKGYKSEVEEAHAIIAQLTSRAPLLAWRDWTDRFESYQRSGFDLTYWHTHLSPAGIHDEQAGLQWMQLDLTTAEIEASASGGEAAAVGAPAEPPVLHLSVELARARVVRPWMDPALFRSRIWKLDHGEPLSDGGRPPRGRLVAYVSAVILARKLDALLVDATAGRALLARGQAEGDAAPSLGCFSLEGASVDRSCGAIRAPGMQIIAYLCQLLPRSPDPDPELRWIEEAKDTAPQQ